MDLQEGHLAKDTWNQVDKNLCEKATSKTQTTSDKHGQDVRDTGYPVSATIARGEGGVRDVLQNIFHLRNWREDMPRPRQSFLI